MPALPGNEWDLRMLIPVAVQCLVSGESWAIGCKADAENALMSKEAKSLFT